MDWANESYVRIYTRDTPDDLVLSWQAHAMWPLLVRKADRAGVIATNHGIRGIAALIRWPIDVVGPAFAELLDDGRIRECSEPHGYVLPNYVPAQETPSSDKQRKREERERRSVLANNSVTKRDSEVTKRDEMSRAVTPRHAPSHGVTPRHSVLCSAVLDPVQCSAESPSGSAGAPARDPTVPVPVYEPDGFFDFAARSQDQAGPEPEWWGNPPQDAKPAPKPRQRRKPSTALTPDWVPARPYPVPDGVDVGRELQRFRNHALSSDRRQSDWEAAWRNWLLKAEEMAGDRKKRSHGQESAVSVAIRLAGGDP